MKRIILITVFLILLSPFLVLAEKKVISDFDGNEWRAWDLMRKNGFISGFLAGTTYVIGENTPFFRWYMGEDYDTIKAERAYRDYMESEVHDLLKEVIDKAKETPKPAAKEEAKPAAAPAPPAPEARKQRYSRDEVSLLLEREYRNSRERLTHYNIIGITNGQIVDGLNLFYDDFRNRQIKLTDAIYVIKKQILGASKEEIEAITEWLRDPDRNYEKRRYKDKEGNLKFADWP